MPIEIATAAEILDLQQEVRGLSAQMQALTRAFEAQTRSGVPEWLTVKETAAYLRLAPDTIRRKVRAGHFDTRREGKNILIRRESVLDAS